MNTNDLKKGMRVVLRNGWYATIADNAKGNTRMAEVEGYTREIGSVYSHDIMRVERDGEWHAIQHTPQQLKLHNTMEEMYGR